MSKKSSTVEFIEKSIKIHGNKYTYELVDYVNAHIKVKIICSIHNIFELTPNKHLSRKCGCPKCGKLQQIESNKSTISDFINKANKIHSFKYNYSLSKYKSSHEKILILCNKHGYFKQAPCKHLLGNGCPNCGNESISKKASENPVGWTYINWENAGLRSKEFDSFKLYVIECYNDNEKFYKIGKTFLKINKRFHNRKSMPYNYKILKIYINESRKISELENELKNINKQYKYIPIMKFSGRYECFKHLNNYEDFFNSK